MSVSIGNYLQNQSASTSQLSTNTSGQSASGGTSGTTASGQASLNTNYQTFLTLLTTQLKNQDPTSPLDPNAFTTELVQLTGVQQQLNTNTLLQQLVNNSPSTGVSGSVDLIGKSVTATSATATLTGGQASWSYTLPQAAANATVSVTNSTGQVVYSATAPSFAAGTSAFTWNGVNSAGVKLPDGGVYTLAVTATDVNGSALTPTLSISGVVSAVENVDGVANVTINGAQAPVSNITKVGS